jgi:DNA-binding transcriptional LysR family regulator
MDWDDVRHFLALSRAGSVRAAGASLKVSHSTVARRVEALEERLAARLFDRTRDGYTLTEAGRRMLDTAERIEREMSDLERGLVGVDERLEGPVALTCSDHFIAGLLLPDLAEFCRAYPGIELCLTVDPRPYDLSRREADLALRVLAHGAQPPEHLVGGKLAPVVLASYVAAAHADRVDPAHGSLTARWLSFEQRKIHEGLIAESSFPEVPPWGRFTTVELLVMAAREGLGAVMLPTYVGDREPSLRRLARPDLRHVADLWMLSHPDLRDNVRLRALRERVRRTLTQHRALFQGEGWCAPAPEGPANAPSATGAPRLG